MEETLLNKQLKTMRLKVLGNTTDTSKDELFKVYLDDAKYIALDALYPFDLEKTELPSRIAENWQVRCAIELKTIADDEGYLKYAENGLSWEKASAYLSDGLKSELTPKAGVPK